MLLFFFVRVRFSVFVLLRRVAFSVLFICVEVSVFVCFWVFFFALERFFLRSSGSMTQRQVAVV